MVGGGDAITTKQRINRNNTHFQSRRWNQHFAVIMAVLLRVCRHVCHHQYQAPSCPLLDALGHIGHIAHFQLSRLILNTQYIHKYALTDHTLSVCSCWIHSEIMQDLIRIHTRLMDDREEERSVCISGLHLSLSGLVGIQGSSRLLWRCRNKEMQMSAVLSRRGLFSETTARPR